MSAMTKSEDGPRPFPVWSRLACGANNHNYLMSVGREISLRCRVTGAVVRSTSMERKKASEFPQELLNLFDRYAHGEIHRREFLDGAKKCGPRHNRDNPLRDAPTE